MGFTRTLSLTLAAASANNIALSQTPGTGGNLTINGAAASGGVATLDVPRRVLISTLGGDNTGITFTVYGTGSNGLVQNETISGGNSAAVYTTHNFKTVTRIAVSGATTGAVTVGTNGVASTAPWIVDQWTNNPNIGLGSEITGTVNYTVEFSMDDYSPLWDLNSVTPVWYSVFGFEAQTSNVYGTLNQPCTMVRLTVNSGTGTAVIKGFQSAIFVPA